MYFTPEILLGSKTWRKLLVGDVYSSRLRVVVIDEAHTGKMVSGLTCTVWF